MQLGKNTHSYGHTGRKRARWPHLFIAVFECPLYGWQFSAKFEKIWIVHPFTLLDRAIFVWPWKKVSVRRFVICFISQWMKRSKHGLFVFPPKKSCCSMTSKRSIGWFFEINIFGMRFFYPRVRLTQPKATRVCNRSINQSNRSIPFICFFCFLRAFSFQGHTKIALVHPFTSSNHEIRNKFQRTSPVSCSLDRNYV